MNHLAAEYGVSSSYLARVCLALNVPRPPVGYWQQKAVGKDKPRPQLPEAQPGDQVNWSNDVPLAKPVAQPKRTARRRTAKVDAQTEREWEEQRERWRREEDHRKVKAAKEESGMQLSEIIKQWSVAMSVEQFFRQAEQRIAQAPEDRRGPSSERLERARSMIGTIDPLDFLEGWVAPEERYKSIYPDD